MHIKFATHDISKCTAIVAIDDDDGSTKKKKEKKKRKQKQNIPSLI